LKRFDYETDKSKKFRIAEKVFFIVIAKLRRSYGNLSSDGFEITTSFCFRKTPRDDIEIKGFFSNPNLTFFYKSVIVIENGDINPEPFYHKNRIIQLN